MGKKLPNRLILITMVSVFLWSFPAFGATAKDPCAGKQGMELQQCRSEQAALQKSNEAQKKQTSNKAQMETHKKLQGLMKKTK